MAPATEVVVSIPLYKRQSDCPVLFPTDCGDGYCCGATDTCVGSRGSARCAFSGGPIDVPAVPGASTPLPGKQHQHGRCHSVSCGTGQTLIIVLPTASSTSISSSTSHSTSTPSSTGQTSTATQSSQRGMGSGQVAGIAIGSSIGGIMVILFIISTLMWYHRRKLPRSENASDQGFHPATDSVRAMVDSPGYPGSSNQIVSMYDPVAWRENYSAACPQELEGRPSVQYPRHVASEAGLRGSGVSMLSPVGTISSQGRVSHSSSGSSRMSKNSMAANGDQPPSYARRTSARGTPIAELE